MSKSQPFWEQVHDACDTAGPVVGAVTGSVYGLGAEGVTLNPVAAALVEKAIGGFVTENWSHVCDLPQNSWMALFESSSAERPTPTPADHSIDFDR